MMMTMMMMIMMTKFDNEVLRGISDRKREREEYSMNSENYIMTCTNILMK